MRRLRRAFAVVLVLLASFLAWRSATGSRDDARGAELDPGGGPAADALSDGAADGHGGPGPGGVRRAALPPVADAPGTPGPADACVVELREASGRPAAGLGVLVVRGEDEILARGVSGPSGSVAFPAFEAPARVLALAGSALLLDAPLATGHGRHVLELPGPAALAGRVLVAGAPPVEPLRLAFPTRGAATPPWPLPGPVADALGWRPGQAPLPVVTTDADGRFRLPGLAPDWSGAVTLPDGYRFAAGAEPRRPLTPREDLVLLLEAVPALTGRVLQPDGTTPAAGAWVGHAVECAGGGGQGSVLADEDGRFSIPLACSPALRAHLEASLDGVGHRVLDLHDVPPEGRDLGDVVLEAVSDLGFVVLDAQGKPVPGAVARFGWFRSPPTDAEGRSHLAGLPLSARRLGFHALGHRSREVAVPPAARDEGLVVHLDALAVLEVAVHDPDGRPVPGLELVVESTAALFEGGRDGPEEEQRLLGAAAPQGVRRVGASANAPGRSTTSFLTDAAGAVVLSGLEPGLPLTLLLLDGAGIEVARTTVAALARGERRALELRTPAAARWVHLRIADPEGRPVPGAAVELGGRPPGRRWHESADGRGRIVLGPLFTDVLDLKASGRGFADRVLLDWHPSGGAAEEEVRLQPPRTVEVRVQDPGGRPVERVGLRAELGPFAVGRVLPAPPGGFEVEGLPPETVRLVAVAGRARAERAVAPTESRVVIELAAAD